MLGAGGKPAVAVGRHNRRVLRCRIGLAKLSGGTAGTEQVRKHQLAISVLRRSIPHLVLDMTKQ